MKEGFKYVSDTKGKRPRLFILLFLTLAVASWVGLRLLPKVNPVFFQVLMMTSLLVAVYILVRFVTTAFVYEVLYEEEIAYLLVIQQQGRRLFTKCKLPLYALVRIVEVTPDAPLPADVPHPVLNYSSVMLEDSYTVLVFRAEGKNTVLRIHANEAFVNALRSAAAEQVRADGEDTPVYDPAKSCGVGTDGYFSGRATSPFSLTEEETAVGKAAPSDRTAPNDGGGEAET